MSKTVWSYSHLELVRLTGTQHKPPVLVHCICTAIRFCSILAAGKYSVKENVNDYQKSYNKVLTF